LPNQTSVITAYKVSKSNRTDIVSTKNLSQHFEYLVKMQAISNYRLTLFVRVNTGVTENAGMENARPKSDTGKPAADEKCAARRRRRS